MRGRVRAVLLVVYSGLLSLPFLCLVREESRRGEDVRGSVLLGGRLGGDDEGGLDDAVLRAVCGGGESGDAPLCERVAVPWRGEGEDGLIVGCVSFIGFVFVFVNCIHGMGEVIWVALV